MISKSGGERGNTVHCWQQTGTTSSRKKMALSIKIKMYIILDQAFALRRNYPR